MRRAFRSVGLGLLLLVTASCSEPAASPGTSETSGPPTTGDEAATSVSLALNSAALPEAPTAVGGQLDIELGLALLSANPPSESYSIRTKLVENSDPSTFEWTDEFQVASDDARLTNGQAIRRSIQVPSTAHAGRYQVLVSVQRPHDAQPERLQYGAAMREVATGNPPTYLYEVGFLDLASPVVLPPAPVTLGRIMPLGDSITYGTGTTDKNSYRKSLFDQLTAAKATFSFVGRVKTGSFAQPNNEGYPGYRIDNDAALVYDALLAGGPEIVLVMLGTNDILQNYDLGHAPDRLQALVAQILDHRPDAKVLVSEVVPIFDYPACNGRTPTCDESAKTYNAAIKTKVDELTQAGRAVRFVQVHDKLVKDDYLIDGVHPGDAGAAKVAASFYDGLKLFYPTLP
jgi:lysophospholipase L1-like esterase